MPGRFELKPTLAKIWHAPDNFRIMDPLPPLHRRGIIIGALLIVIGFLLPSGSDNVDTAPVSRNAELDIQSQSQPQPGSQPMQTQLVTPSNDPGQVAPVEPEPVQEDQELAATPSEPQAQQPTGIEQQWRSYRVEPGKTLAQLFRDHNLPATDVYAMAQVEGQASRSATCKMVRWCRSVRTPAGW